MDFVVNILRESWRLLMEASVYVLFGMVVAGLMKMFLSPGTVARHLGQGKVLPVLKAALLGVPMPLCSCGVLPAAAAIKRQGANNGAMTAFLISTPETGVDSIAISYALLDPLLTIARPLAAVVTAVVAGVLENVVGKSSTGVGQPDLSCPVDACCSGEDCEPEDHARHHTLLEKLQAGMKYAFGELWADLAGWFLIGVLLSGVIGAAVPANALAQYLGGGMTSMLIMLVIGVPLYICASASTPIAAALIMKGVSPGAALVFLLTGPATNATTLTVLFGMLGKRAAAIYLATIAVMAVAFGLAVDWMYVALGISMRARIGQAGEIVPAYLQIAGAVVLLALSVKPVYRGLARRLSRAPATESCTCRHEGEACAYEHEHDHAGH
jgi:uncharacterized protein